MNTFQIPVGTNPFFQARVENVAGTPLVPADLASIDYAVTDVAGNTLIAPTVLDHNAVIFATLQPWSLDAVGYNFAFRPDVSAFPLPTWYTLDVRFVVANSGVIIKNRWNVRALDNRA